MISKIPFEFVAIESDGVHIIFEALISKHSCRMLIDTGASRTVFDQNRIDRFISEPELTENEQLSTGLGTNNMRSHIISIPSLIIGDLHLTNYVSVVIDMSHINESFNNYGLKPIDGVLGGDILAEYKAEIDYKKKELRLRVPIKMSYLNKKSEVGK